MLFIISEPLFRCLDFVFQHIGISENSQLDAGNRFAGFRSNICSTQKRACLGQELDAQCSDFFSFWSLQYIHSHLELGFIGRYQERSVQFSKAVCAYGAIQLHLHACWPYRTICTAISLKITGCSISRCFVPVMLMSISLNSINVIQKSWYSSHHVLTVNRKVHFWG